MHIVCIGAAPTGLGAAFRLNELVGEGEARTNDVKLTILEQAPFAGGLSRTEVDEKGFLWDMGGHITFNHNFPYYEKATKWAVDDWNHLIRNCQVDMNYVFDKEGIKLVPYPAQFAVPCFPDKVKQACLKDLNERFENTQHESPTTFEDWIMQHFGPTILENFFRPYTYKVWTVDPSKMSPHWVGTRVAKLPKEKLEELCALTPEELENADFGWGPNATFAFPKYGGTGNVWLSMAKKLPQEYFRYNCRVMDVKYKEKKVVFEEGGEKKEISYDILLNTAPIDLLVNQTQITYPLNLARNKVFVVGVGLKKPYTSFLEDMTWLYFPDKNVPFFRITVLSRYGETTPDNEKYWSLLCECARTIDDEDSEEEVTRQAVEGLIYKTMITREQIVSVYSTTLDYGYPIPTVERDVELSRAHRELERHSIYSRGRFGGWKYEVSNQDHCFMQGKEFIDRMVLNEPEKVYKTGLAMKQG